MIIISRKMFGLPPAVLGTLDSRFSVLVTSAWSSMLLQKKKSLFFLILCLLFTIRLGLTVIYSVLFRESWIAWECLDYIHSINVITLPVFPRPRTKLFLRPLFCLVWILVSHFCWAHRFGSHTAINVL